MDRGASVVRFHAERGNEGVLAVTAAGALTGVFARAITRTFSSAAAGSGAVACAVLGAFRGAGTVFGAVTFAFALAGAAAVTLTGAATSTFALALTTTPSPATGQEDIRVAMMGIKGHSVHGFAWGKQRTAGINRAGIRAEGYSPEDDGQAHSHNENFYAS